MTKKLRTANAYTPNSRYRPEIDGLRALAVVAVIINHFNKEILPSGYLGVDMFFVISGFVITSSLADRPSKNFGDFLIGFYTKRIKRLVPTLVLFVFITSVLLCLLSFEPAVSLRTGIMSLFGLSNLYLLKQSTNYFGSSIALNAFAHTWSLGVEEQFYFLFPFLAWFTGFSRLTVKGGRNLFMTIGALSVTSLIIFVYLYQTDQPAAYFLMPTRLWEMGSGCLLFVGLKHFNSLFRILEAIPPLVVTAAAIAVLFAPLQFAIPATVAIVVLTVALIACLRSGTVTYNLFTQKRVVYIGLISYSLYLWHWGILSISRWTIGIHWYSVPFQVAFLLLLSITSYHYVETPLRRSDWSTHRWQSIGYGVCASIGTAIMLLGLAVPLKKALHQLSKTIIPNKYEAPGSVQKELYCHLPKNTDNAFNDCLKQSESGKKRTIYIVGDSHASNHFPSIKEAIRTLPDFSVRFLIDWGFIKSLEGNENCGSSDPCIKDSWQKHLAFFRENLRQGDLIVFSWFRDHVVQEGLMPRKVDATALAILRNKIDAIADIAKSRGALLVLVDDIPRVCNANVLFEINILRYGELDLCKVKKEISKEDRKGITDLYKSIERPEVFYIDFHDYLCGVKECEISVPGSSELMYGDAEGHFSSSHPKPLTKQWRKFLANLN